MTTQECWELREKLLADFLATKITFGKYRGDTWGLIIEANPSYIIWADENVEWLTIPPEIVNQAQANKSAKKDIVEEDYYLHGYDPYDYFD